MRSNRIISEIELRPILGNRFQPTGFPDLGAATFQRAGLAGPGVLEALGELGADNQLQLDPGQREILVGKNIRRLLAAQIEIAPALARAIRRPDPGGLRLAAG